MKRFPKTELLTLITVVLGVGGMFLQRWLLSRMDRDGLLPVRTFSVALPLILMAVTVVACLIFLRNVKTADDHEAMFPRSVVAAMGNFVVAVGIALSALSLEADSPLMPMVRILGLLSACALAFVGIYRLRRRRPSCLLHTSVVLFLIFRTLLCCQDWSAETQVVLYFFPLLTHLFLLLTTYYRAALEADIKNCPQYLFFRQLTLFCCLVSLAGNDRWFCLVGAVWMITDFCVPAFIEKTDE